MSNSSVKTGVLLALAAYCMWGFAPMYFKLLLAMPAGEILVHRILWSVLFLALLVLVSGEWLNVKNALKNHKVILILLVSGILLATNWLVFIWAINNDKLLEASLGYYINPLLNVLLGRLFLGERLSRMQKIAVGIALTGVLILVVSFGNVPWIALALAISFGIYGLLRKQVAVGALPGLLVETAMMVPFAVIYLWLFSTELSNMASNSLSWNTLLVVAGVVTTAPLLCFTSAARRLRYSTIGFFQYIGPSIMFLLAVFYYAEPFNPERLITFGFVWSALVIFSFDSYRTYSRLKPDLKY